MQISWIHHCLNYKFEDYSVLVYWMSSWNFYNNSFKRKKLFFILRCRKSNYLSNDIIFRRFRSAATYIVEFLGLFRKKLKIQYWSVNTLGVLTWKYMSFKQFIVGLVHIVHDIVLLENWNIGLPNDTYIFDSTSKQVAKKYRIYPSIYRNAF